MQPLGHGDDLGALVPTRVQALVDVQLAGAAARGHHTLVWTEEGDVYTFGEGGNGQLGHGVRADEPVPRLVEGPLVGKKVIGASAATEHSLVWTEESEIYSFGYGQDGRLGHGGEEPEYSPRMIEGSMTAP